MQDEQLQEGAKRFLDEQGRIAVWPSKHGKKRDILSYLATKFEVGRDYTEKEVNAIIDSWHTFQDYFLLRRELIEHRLLFRERDGSRYWRADTQASEDMPQQ